MLGSLAMRRSVRLVAILAPGLAAPALIGAALGGCFDFDATMAGGPSELGDGATITQGADAHTQPDTSVPPSSDDGGPNGESDGGGTVDTGTGGDADAGSTPSGDGGFCASIAPGAGTIFFCDDFDEHPLPGAWSTWHVISGTIEETEAGAASAPNSVDETINALPPFTSLDVALRTPLPVPTSLPATLRFAFALEPIQIDTTANAAIVLGAVDFIDSAQDRYSVELAINVVNGAAALALGEQYGGGDGGPPPDGGPPYINHPLPPTQPLPMNAWSNIVIEIDWKGPYSAEGIVTIGGATQLDVPLSLSVVPTSLQIGIGTSYVSEPSPVWELRYDNVWFTAK
jgi:hypothetical protein